MSDYKKTFGFMALLSAIVILPFLGETIFYSKGEPREAIVAYSMLESGNWILPLNYGTDIAYKPPFLYWSIAAISALAGGVSEFTSRMPSALAFLAMLWAFFGFVARRNDTKTAWLTSLLLLTSFEVHRAAVACRLDMLQVAFIVTSLCLLFRWDERGCKRIPWLAVLLMACGTLTKGPVGSIFPCMCIGLYQLLRGRPFVRTFLSLAGIGLLSLIPLGIWFYAAWQQGGQSFVDLMLEENTGRFFRKMSYPSHHNPFWYNFLTLIWGWLPWTPVLLVAGCLSWKAGSRETITASWPERLKAAWTRFRSQPPLQLFTWVVILAIFIFYCIPKSKRSVYLLPIYPFMALLMAQYLLALVQKGSRVFKGAAYFFSSLCLLLTAVFFTVRAGLVPDSIWGSGKHAAENIAFVQALETASFSVPQWLIILLPVVAAGCTLAVVFRKEGIRSQLYGVIGCMLCLFVSLDGVYQPTILAVKSDKRLVEDINRHVPEGVVYSYTDRMIRFYCANYYLNDRMRNFTLENPQSGHVILSEAVREEFLKTYGETYRLEEVFHTDYRSCDLRAKVVMYRFSLK